MNKKFKIIILSIFFLLTIAFTCYAATTKDVLNYFKKIKYASVNYCGFDISRPGFSLHKDLDKDDLVLLVKLLNNIKSTSEGSFPTPKGGFTGLTLNMKSKESFTFYRVNGGLWICYHNKGYRIVVPKYDEFFQVIYHKYTAEYDDKKISDIVKYKNLPISKIIVYDSRLGNEAPITVENEVKINEFMGYIDSYTIAKETIRIVPKTWTYEAEFYSRSKVVMRIFFSNPLTLNGNYYFIHKAGLDDHKIGDFINSL